MKLHIISRAEIQLNLVYVYGLHGLAIYVRMQVPLRCE